MGAIFDAIATESAIDARGAVPIQLSSSLSLIEKKLSQIESVVSALTSGSVIAPPPMVGTNQSTQRVEELFHDENEPTAGEASDIVPKENVDFQEESRIQFGNTLATLVGVRNLSIRVATSLPQNTNKNTAFSQSYAYSHSTRTLFVHQSRISSSGDFGLILIHALSHMKLFPEAQDRWSDQNPAFISEFYTNLRILSQDLYKRSMSLGDAGGKSSLQRSPSTLSRQASKRQFLGALGSSVSGLGLGRAPSLRTPATDELDSSKIASDAESQRSDDFDDYFQSVSIEDRLKKYVKAGGLPSDFVDRYAKDKSSKRV